MAVHQTVGVTANLFPAPQNHYTSSIPPYLLSLSFPIQTKRKLLGFYRCLSCSIDHSEHSESIAYPKPTGIQWKKDLSNTVQLIGVVGTAVQSKLLTSGKFLAWTRLGVRKSATDSFWINLTFWDELAHTANQHVEKGHRIYVSGRLVLDMVENDDEQWETYYKVVVQQLNFVENSFSSMPLNEHEANSMIEDRKLRNSASNIMVSTRELWQAFFANPLEWWDNRKNKKNPKYPDFKHKDTGEALWVEGKYNPNWVKSQLAILDSRMESFKAHEANMSFDFLAADTSTSFLKKL
ncbi:hypothetical protein F0562_000408 [Nyssa sinensis]|uniref:Single-stranded DNA-binding protein n=1 Tax=Nyssa sinensis TaxID=561372 RepID=A0A5J5C1I4_9ASTE|nr:hypothetical protein F0562_000408 [Nyssa sinensis]